jgi:hypothetical protein
MVPTRHFSTVCRRRICAARSGAMVMTPPLPQAVTQEAQPQCRRLPLAAAAAGPTGGGRGDSGSGGGGGFLRCARRCDDGSHVGRCDGSAVVCACPQWSAGPHRSGTLMRHVVGTAVRLRVQDRASLASPALTPTLRALGVGDAATPGALVALRSLPLRLVTGLTPAGSVAVAVAPVAVAAQDDLDAASRAQVQAGGLVHAHPGTTEVLDGLVPARHTAAAPPSSARCRARYGRQA